MPATPENDSSPKPAETPLFSVGKKIVFLGALLVWGGFFLPWFASISLWGSSANAPGGAEIPWSIGWIVLAMAFLAVILPDAFPDLGPGMVKTLSLCALALGIAVLALLFASSTGATKPGFYCGATGYIFLLAGVLKDSAASATSARR